MSKLVSIPGGDVLDTLKNKGGLDKYKPYSKDIYLFSTHIAGTSHVPNILELEPHIIENLEVHFFREPNNPFDKKAIVIRDNDNNKIGYVPRDRNDIISNLMDAGKIIFGKVTGKELKNKYVDIKIDVYFKD